MIESRFWKEELTRIARTLRRVPKPRRFSERALCIVERDLMVGFFILRRLIELHKVSSVTRDWKVRVFSNPTRGKEVNRISLGGFPDLYDFEGEKPTTKKPAYIANQFIHSYVSFVARDESRNWSDAYVVSDYDRQECIWRVPVEEVRKLFEAASKDYPHSLTMKYNPKNRDYTVKTN